MSSKIKKLLIIATFLFMGIYIFSSLILTGPNNPIKVKWYSQIYNLMSPHFLQNWNLFAPDPVADDRGVLVKLQCSDGSETPYIDITTPLIDEARSTRFFGSRELRIISNGIGKRFERDELIQEISKNSKKDNAIHEIINNNRSINEDASEHLLSRYASLKLSNECSNGTIKATKLRFVIHAYPGWSDRKDWIKMGEITQWDTDWRYVS